jgi:hypothetical protein
MLDCPTFAAFLRNTIAGADLAGLNDEQATWNWANNVGPSHRKLWLADAERVLADVGKYRNSINSLGRRVLDEKQARAWLRRLVKIVKRVHEAET